MAHNTVRAEDLMDPDDRPVALGRKRRHSTTQAGRLHESKIEPADDSKVNPPGPDKTPAKPKKKKVRFSDPGPDISAPAASSTGLTPALRRTSFTSFQPVRTPRLLARSSRPPSLPNLRASTLPSPNLSDGPGSFSGEIQFAPLCTLLDDRVKRQLRRRNLSEEQNEIEAEKKSDRQCKCELHGDVDGKSRASRNSNGEEELQEGKRDRSNTAEPAVPTQASFELPTPSSTIFVDDTAVDLVETDASTARTLRDQAPRAEVSNYKDVSTQDALPNPQEIEMLRSARLSLEYLFPGEVTLGLVSENPGPLIDTLLERLKTLKTQMLIAKDSLSTMQDQESNLRTQFNAVLEQLDRARKYAEKVSTDQTAQKARAESAENKIEAFEASLQHSSTRVQELDASTDEKDRSIQKLQEALESYRTEVGKLELLITRIEREHQTAMAKLKSEMDEAVADLECHVTAEIIGRRAAEAVVEQRDQQILELRSREKELMASINEKQQIIRNAERAFTEERSGAEREVGTLNVRISQLSSDLFTSERARDVLVRRLDEENKASMRAIAAVQEELRQCSRNTQGIKDAHASESKKRGADVMEHKGLLTPTTGGRFRDADEIEGIEGFVEVNRGKGKGRMRKRPDSGIVMLEEDADDEDLLMNDC